MIKKEPPVRFCRFKVDGHIYSGRLRGTSVDIVEGDPFSGFSSIRISYPAERVKFLVPFTPKKIWAIGLNYTDHAKESHFEIPKEPVVFMKSISALTGPTDFIRIPDWAGAIHYEGELAVAIGTGGAIFPRKKLLTMS